MSRLSWYCHRLRAMGAGEVALHIRKKLRQFSDARGVRDWPLIQLDAPAPFPRLPKPEVAPRVLREALHQDADRILAGRWCAFTHLDLRVDDPPRWHKDYLAGIDLETTESAFQLNHRDLPNGADVKLIWELSRWYEVARLALAAYVRDDARAAAKCLDWLEDWVKHNPPYRGWNWTSALEAGMRLVQFTWIDALLEAQRGSSKTDIPTRLSALRRAILPAHVWFTWRHRSFGSSANNHLIGELAGLILATVRWPELARCGARLDLLQGMWEREVRHQFAADGGNREQALNYHLFSFEFCWQVRNAIQGAGRQVSDLVEERLLRAARFFWDMQVAREPWDYGDSDNAYVTPLFANAKTATAEWRRWMAGQESPALRYWLGDFPRLHMQIGYGPPAHAIEAGPWWFYQKSGLAVAESGFWFLRWDLSPLGYLKTAAHGHLDALHLSVWYRGVAFIIDPGTGAYYGDKPLRTWLASRAAHNGPCPPGPEQPQRLGPFLWSEQHLAPQFLNTEFTQTGVLNLTGVQLRRTVTGVRSHALGFQVEDSCILKNGQPGEFSVRWQFAPGTRIKQLTPRKFILKRSDVSIEMEVSPDWAAVLLVETQNDPDRAKSAATDGENIFAGTVSPAFRKTEWAPYLKLIARPKPGQSCVFSTTFVASPPS